MADDKNYQCSMCAKVYGTKTSLRRHLTQIHNYKIPEKQFPCSHCNRSYAYKSSLLAHARTKHHQKDEVSRKGVKCQFCPVEFVRRDVMYKHMKHFHPTEEIPYQRRPTCNVCGEKFPTTTSLKRHRVKYHRRLEDEETFWGDPREPPSSSGESDGPERPTNSRKLSIGRSDMSIRGETTDQELQGRRNSTRKRTGAPLHETKSKKGRGGESDSLSSQDPEDSGGTSGDDSNQPHSGNGNGGRGDKGDDDDDGWEDDDCDDDDEEGPFLCLFCDEEFRTQLELDLHIEEMHQNGEIPGGSSISCHFCKKRFTYLTDLARHMKKEHAQKKRPSDERKRFPCPHCSLTFPRRATVRVHIKRRHREMIAEEDRLPEDSEQDLSSSESEDEDETVQDWIHRLLVTDDPDLLYNLHDNPWWSRNSRLNCEQAKINFRLTRRAIRLCDLGYSFEVLRRVLARILNRFIRGDPHAWLQIKVDSNSLNYPMVSESSPDLDFVLAGILDQAYRVLGSNDRFMIDSILKIEVTYISPDGRSLLREKHGMYGAKVSFQECDGLDEYCQLIRSCWTPITFPPDYGCLGSAIVAGIWVARDQRQGKDPVKQRWYQRSETHVGFQAAVDDLYNEAGVSRSEPQTWIDFFHFQVALNRIGGEYGKQIVAYNSRDRNDYFYLGRPFRATQANRINLAVSKTHVYLIKDLGRFLGKSVCMDCSAVYSKKYKHTSCQLICPDCKTAECYKLQKSPGTYSPQPCDQCFRIFHNRYCWNYHNWNGICQNWALCLQCHKIVKRKFGDWQPQLEDHNCHDGTVRCRHCRKDFDIPRGENEKPHYCCVKRPIPKKVRTPEKFYIIAFDYETVAKKVRNRKRKCYGKKRQYPFMASAVIFCEKCFEQKGDWPRTCPTRGCGKKQRTWYNRPLAFARWLLYDPERRRNVKTVALSHNGKRFDNFFPLTYLLRSNKKPQLLSHGHQIITMKAGRVVFKDFMAFCPQKLANLPKAFGFEERITKGFYPWRYAKAGNLNEGPRRRLPRRWYYGNDLFKSVKEEEEFETWYGRHERKGFHLKKVAKKYCKGDAEILGRSIQYYTTLGLELSDGKVNPILADGCLTLASFVSLVYRACFMPHEYAIGLIPSMGYNTDKRQSVFVAKTLDWMNHKRGQMNLPLIRHKFSRGGEKLIGQSRVDGWIEETGQAIQIHGCWYHGHETCSSTGQLNKGSGGKFGDRGMERIHPLFKVPYRAVAQRSLWKDYNLAKHPDVSSLKVIWECSIRKELALDPLFRAYWNSRSRMTSYWKSLDSREALFGGQNSECDHDDPTERGLVGTYTIQDLEFAMASGYRLVQVFEVHSYRKRPQTRKLFSGMIKTLIKRKAESSDWPEDAITPEEKKKYLDYWRREFGIIIDPEKVKHNIGMRSLIKLFLVALWGKFAEKPKQTIREYVKTWSKLKSIVFDSRYRVTDLFFEDSKSTYALVCYERLDQDTVETSLHNVVIGAHVTTHARHALLGFLRQVAYRVLYCDTDGFCYIHRPGMPDPGPQGKALGQLCNELPPNCYIRRFQSLGPKNYRIEIVNRITGEVTVVWKAKGIMRTNVVCRALDGDTYQALIEQRLEHLVDFYRRLSSETGAERSLAIAKAIKLFRMVKTVQEIGGGEPRCCLFLPNPSIRRDLKQAIIYNDDEGVKLMRLTAVKRVYPPSAACNNHTSLPMGWKLDRNFDIGL